MRSVGLKILKNKLSEYIRLASAGETVLVTDRDRVVAEIVPPQPGHQAASHDESDSARRARGLADAGDRAARRALAPAQPGDVFRGVDGGPGARPRGPVIYLDSSVALTCLFVEGQLPPETIWRQPTGFEPGFCSTSSGMECTHAVPHDVGHTDQAKALVSRVTLIDLLPRVLARALEPISNTGSNAWTGFTWRRSNSCAQADRRSNWQAMTDGSSICARALGFRFVRCDCAAAPHEARPRQKPTRAPCAAGRRSFPAGRARACTAAPARGSHSARASP